MFDRPSLALLISYATFPNLAAFAFVSYISFIQGRVIDILGWLVVLFILFENLYAITMHLQGEFESFKRDNIEPSVISNQQSAAPRNIPNLNKPIFENVVPVVKINVEMLFARTIIAQSRGQLDVKLTEDFWIKQGHWQRLGGVGALDFRDMLARWDKAKAIGRKNPNAGNSTYIVIDREKVARVAAGEKL